jgi:hypothetical protein
VFAPLFWFALRRPPAGSQAGTRADGARRLARRAAGVMLAAAWLLSLWLLFSTDPIRERIVRLALRDQTEFAPGFSETAFQAIEDGQAADQVRARLGEPFRKFETPLGECWLYSRGPDAAYFRGRAVCFDRGRVSTVVSRWLRM